jgi:hypothetical protein
MKINPIFVAGNSEDGNGIWAIHLNGKSKNEFDSFFECVNNAEWLYNFFDKNIDDLTDGFFGDITISQAVLLTLKEAKEMKDVLYEFCTEGFLANNANLQHLFKSLNNFEYCINNHQKSKYRIGRSGWLRLYAIRLAKNCYVVTGGAIKLSRDMKRDHLQQELKKLELTKSFLRNNGVDYPEDLNIIL